MRQMRDLLADKQSQNRAMQFVLDKEEHLATHKAGLEARALKMLQNDLEHQILGIQTSNEKFDGKVTPSAMEA